MKRTIRQPSGFEGNELSGYFMIANADAAIAISNKLTGSQLRLWLCLMMIDSFGDSTADGEKIYHSIPSPQELAVRIGVSVETVEKDMRRLKKLGLYDYRVTCWQGHNSSAANAKSESSRLREKKSPQTQTEKGRGLNKPPERLNNPSESLNKPPERLNNPSESLNNPSENAEKPAQQPLQSSSQTIQTYQTFTNSLSEGERESFENFCKKEVAGFPRPIINLCDYLAADDGSGQPRYLGFWQRFGKTKTGAELRSQQAAAALTPELYERWDKEFRAIGCNYIKFAAEDPYRSPERDLKMKFFEKWDENNVVPILH